MDNTSDIRVGDRLRIADPFGITHEVTAQKVDHAGKTSIVDIRFDEGVSGWLLSAPVFGTRFHMLGWVVSHDVAGLVIVPRATDLEDEDETCGRQVA